MMKGISNCKFAPKIVLCGLGKLLTFGMCHKWMINDKILLADVHPIHFSLSKRETGKSWEETNKKLDAEWSNSHYVLRQPRYESMVNFWSGAMANNSVQIDAFLSE